MISVVSRGSVRVAAYNMKPSRVDRLRAGLSQLIAWTKQRRTALDNILLQKMGLFHAQQSLRAAVAPANVASAPTEAPSDEATNAAVATPTATSAPPPVSFPRLVADLASVEVLLRESAPPASGATLPRRER